MRSNTRKRGNINGIVPIKAKKRGVKGRRCVLYIGKNPMDEKNMAIPFISHIKVRWIFIKEKIKWYEELLISHFSFSLNSSILTGAYRIKHVRPFFGLGIKNIYDVDGKH